MSKDEIMYKIITLGDSGVGKTSIIRRFANNIFDENILSTVGVGFGFKEVELKNKKKIKLKLIDTAGQEKFKALAKSYFKNVDGVLFVYSFEISESFENLKEWIKLFYTNHNGKTGIPMILAGNKSDLEEEDQVENNNKMVKDFLEEFKEFKYYKTSAKDNISINELFLDLAEKIYSNEKEGKKEHNVVKLENSKKKKHHCANCLRTT
jgi:small GTP-binding protein